jgi:hypothetical protein
MAGGGTEFSRKLAGFRLGRGLSQDELARSSAPSDCSDCSRCPTSRPGCWPLCSISRLLTRRRSPITWPTPSCLVDHRRFFLGLRVLIAGGAVPIQMYVRRRFPTLTEHAHNDDGSDRRARGGVWMIDRAIGDVVANDHRLPVVTTCD